MSLVLISLNHILLAYTTDREAKSSLAANFSLVANVKVF